MASWSDIWNEITDIPQNLLGYLSGKNAKDVQQAYGNAIGQQQQNTQQLMDFYNQRQAKAQALYGPMQALFARTYGSGKIGRAHV